MKAEDVRASLPPGFAALALDHFGKRYRPRGRELKTHDCPACGHRSRPDAVSINTADGRWQCKARGCKGDVFALVAGYAGLDIKRDFPAAINLTASIAGLSDDPDPERDRRIAEARQRAEEISKRERAERAELLATMPARWSALDRRSLRGERYLAGRRIEPSALRTRGDVVRFSPNGDPAVALRDLETGAIVGIQYRCLDGATKLRAERGSQLAGSALLGAPCDIDAEGVDVAIIVEGLADTLAACLAFPTCAVFGAPGAGQMARIAAAVAPRIAAVRGWLLIAVDDDSAGIGNASDAIVAAVGAGLHLAEADSRLDTDGAVDVVDIGAHHDLAEAFAAGWRYQFPGQVAL